MTDERTQAIVVANRLLDEPYADPDDDLRMLARQFIRAVETKAPHATLNDYLALVDSLEYHLRNACHDLSVGGDKAAAKEASNDLRVAIANLLAQTGSGVNAQPIPVTEIVAALERESANTDTDPRWLAAVELRRMAAWEARTLMCRIDLRPSGVQSSVKSEGSQS